MYSRHVMTSSLIWIISSTLPDSNPRTHLVRVRLLRSNHHQQLLQDSPEQRETLRKLGASKESVRLGHFASFDIVQVERDRREDLAKLGDFGVPADVELERWEGGVGGDVDVSELVCLEEEGFEGCELNSGDLAI